MEKNHLIEFDLSKSFYGFVFVDEEKEVTGVLFVKVFDEFVEFF